MVCIFSDTYKDDLLASMLGAAVRKAADDTAGVSVFFGSLNPLYV